MRGAREAFVVAGRSFRGRRAALAAAGALASLACACAVPAGAQAEETASWKLETVRPPGVETGPSIGLGKVGDIQFLEPNRGLLITAGKEPSVPAGLWFYDGAGWHELSNQCGATNGRIAWAGPDEFWTVSDGRVGQVEVEGTHPPLADNTLCHFAAGSIVGSYASLAFHPDSYQVMRGAACESATDCWFGGDLLPLGQTGAFHLHWDGSGVTAQANPEGRVVDSMTRYGGRIYEGVHPTLEDSISPPESAIDPSFLHLIAPNGRLPTFTSLLPETSEELSQPLPILAPQEFPYALDYPLLGADGEAMWAAFNPLTRPPAGSAPGEVTVLRYSAGSWTQVLGPTTDPGGVNPYTKYTGSRGENENIQVTSIAPEPGSESAWVALDTNADVSTPNPVAHALIARISANGEITEEQTLPTPSEEAEGVGGKGGAAKITCPAAHDCWLVTTQGRLFHLADAAHRELPRDTDPAFSSLITFRPEDQGIPAVVPDAPPVDNSGISGEAPPPATAVEPAKKQEARVPVALLSNIHAKLVNGTTLRLSFHLAVKARLKLTAKRSRQVVASTPMETLRAGSRSLQLRLDPRRWPTKLSLYSHPLAPLPTISAGNPNIGTLSTRLLTGGPLGSFLPSSLVR